MSSDSESNNFANLSRISDEDIMEEDVEESPTQIDVTRWRHAMFWPCDLNAIFEGKIAQLCSFLKSFFMIWNSNFEIVYLKHYIFILCGKKYCFIGT